MTSVERKLETTEYVLAVADDLLRRSSRFAAWFLAGTLTPEQQQAIESWKADYADWEFDHADCIEAANDSHHRQSDDGPEFGPGGYEIW